MSFVLTVPGTDIELTQVQDTLVAGDLTFATAGEGIWDLVQPDRRPALDTFARAYAAVRAAEGREMSPGEIQTLPMVGPDHPLAAMWEQRAASHSRFKAQLAATAPGSALDIGAGCGWLAADLARAEWQAAAIDVTVDGGDGLSAARYHGAEVLLARAEMEALPFKSDSIDLAVFNASLHYADSVGNAVLEAARVVRPGGQLVVLDSPVYADPAAGQTMVQEFEAHTLDSLGIAAAELQGPGFLTEHDLSTLNFRRVDATRGLRKRLHQWRGTRRVGRETAARPLLIATIGDAS